MLGDLNSAYYEKPMQALNATGNEDEMLGETNNKLYNLWYELKKEDRWEHSFNGVRSTLSHILVSDSLYNNYGFQYVDQSFKVIGHTGKSKEKLISVSGAPYRWQTQKYYNSSFHIGKGYSDHLPLVATFRYRAKPWNVKQRKRTLEKISYQNDPQAHDIPLFNRIKICEESQAINISELHGKEIKTLLGKCVKIIREKPLSAYRLFIKGKYKFNFVKIGPENNSKQVNLRIGINRSYDWRPNLDDSRVSLEEASFPGQDYSSYNWHPKSNKCFARRVLQGKGGYLRKAVGRLAYMQGFLTLSVASRENKNITLESLPEKKRNACPWID